MPGRPTTIRLAAALGAVLLAAGPARAQIDLGGQAGRAATPPRAAELVDVRVLADVERVVPGATFHVAVAFDIAAKWHIYWIDAGDGGSPTEVEVEAPDGFTVGPARYPRPEQIAGPEGRSLGYHERTVLFVPVRAPARIDATSVVLDVDVYYFVCKDICLIGETKLSIELPVVAPETARRAAPTDDPGRTLLDRYRRRLPAPLRSLEGTTCRLERVEPAPKRRLVLTGPAAGFDAVQLFPIDAPGITFGEPQATVTGDRFRVAVDVDVQPRNALGAPVRVRGVVGLGGRTSDPSYAFDIPVESDP